VKIIEKQRITSAEREQQLRREVWQDHQWYLLHLYSCEIYLCQLSLMKAVNHRHIVQLQEVLSTPTKYYIVLELCSGGELFDKICTCSATQKQQWWWLIFNTVSTGCLNESQARSYFQQLISGVDYMHRHQICHRDLKPGIIIFYSNSRYFHTYICCGIIWVTWPLWSISLLDLLEMIILWCALRREYV